MRTIERLLSACLLSVFIIPQAHSHGLNLVVERTSGQLSGLVTYTDDTPGGHLPVEVSEAEPPFPALAQGQTDAEGRFQLSLDSDEPLRVTVYGDEGHEVQAVVAPFAKETLKSSHHHLDAGALVTKLWLPGLLVALALLIGLARWVAVRKAARRRN